MTPIPITAKNGKARPKNPYKQTTQELYEYDVFESTVKWHDCPGCENGEFEAELIEQGQDHLGDWYDASNEFYDDSPMDYRQIWRIVPQPQEKGLDLNKLEKEVDTFISNQTTESYNKMFDEMDREKEEAKTVEGKTPEEIYKNVHMKYGAMGGNPDKYDLEAMQAYSSQQNTTLMEENERLKKSLGNIIHCQMCSMCRGIAREALGMDDLEN